MDDGVWILGGYQSDFARNLSKENRDFADLTREVVDGTLTAAKVDAADLAAAGVVHVANAFGEMFARQGHLGAMPATVCDDLWDTPPPGTRPRAHPAAWRRSRRWPTCDQARTVSRSSWA
ncbi:keto acyl-CoA thiolase [Mycobacterium tuberculosis]|nr:keto acyl-CoA thiolase [Mycobacterium tuberculosis]